MENTLKRKSADVVVGDGNNNKKGRVVFVLSFPGDHNVQKTDPIAMNNNIQIPLHSVFRREDNLDLVSPTTEEGLKLVISPEFMKSSGLCGEMDIKNIQDWVVNNNMSSRHEDKVRVLRWGANPTRFICEGTSEEGFSKGVENLFGMTIKNNFSGLCKREKFGPVGTTRKFTRNKPLDLSTELTSMPFGRSETMITIKGVASLLTGRFLNDEIVDSGCILGIEACKDTSDICYMTASAWSTAFIHPDDKILQHQLTTLYRRLLTYQPDVFKLKYMVWTVSREKHWTLCVVRNPFPPKASVTKYVKSIEATRDFCEKLKYAKKLYTEWITGVKPEFLIFDSMESELKSKVDNYDEYQSDTLSYLRRCLLEIHGECWRMENNEVLQQFVIGLITHESLHLFVPRRPINVPQQIIKKSPDCGIFVMAYVRVFFKLLKDMAIPYDEVVRSDWTKFFEHDDSITDYRFRLYDLYRYKVARENPNLFERVFKDRNTVPNLLREYHKKLKNKSSKK